MYNLRISSTGFDMPIIQTSYYILVKLREVLKHILVLQRCLMH